MDSSPLALQDLADIRRQLRALGAGPGHEQRVLRLWAQALPQDSGRRRLEDFLPAALRTALPALAGGLAGLARLRSEHPAWAVPGPRLSLQPGRLDLHRRVYRPDLGLSLIHI